MTATFEEVVRAWALDYDDRIPSDRRERREAFIVLLGNLADHGFKKEELTTSKKEKIVKSCVNPNHRDKKKLKSWIEMVVNDLESAVLIYYGTVKIRRDIITPEMESKLLSLEKRAEESRALRSVAIVPDEQITSSYENFNVDGAVRDAFKEAIEYPMAVKEEIFEITDDLLGDVEGPKVEWDVDFMKKLESEDE
jgi:hypothetical protein